MDTRRPRVWPGVFFFLPISIVANCAGKCAKVKSKITSFDGMSYRIFPLAGGLTGYSGAWSGRVLLFEGEGEFFPLGERGGASYAEAVKFSGVFLGLLG